jgi:hypothetical protein
VAETTVKCGATAYVPVSFFNKAGEPATPDTVRYRIQDEHTKRELRAWTEIAGGDLGPTIEVRLAGSDNTPAAGCNAEARHRVVFEATFNGGQDMVPGSVVYRIEPV